VHAWHERKCWKELDGRICCSHENKRPPIRNDKDWVPCEFAGARQGGQQIETAADEMVSVLVSTQSIAAKSLVNYRAWLMKVAHGNVMAAFDFAQTLATAKLVPDVVEYSRARARDQFNALAAQTKELT
jgi:hypothetical protein